MNCFDPLALGPVGRSLATLCIVLLLASNLFYSTNFLNQLNELTITYNVSYTPDATVDMSYTRDSPVDEIVEFERQPGVVIVTKIHGIHQLALLEQSLCLLNFAYNNRMLYDIVVFTTEPIDQLDLAETYRLVAPAKISVVVDNDGLQNEIQALSPDRREKFLARCGVSSPESLTWWSNCPGRIAYNWQAQFRSLHIWKHPAIAKYRYMLFLDSDGFSTRVWQQDPVAFLIKNNLAILFSNFPQGTGVSAVVDRIRSAFNTSLCTVTLQDGKFSVKTDIDCNSRPPLIHGFFHLTDLDFYRSDPVMQWQEKLIGDCFLCRNFDDQVAVTMPAMILAANRSFEMRSNGIFLDVYHNAMIDGKIRVGGFHQYLRDKNGNVTLYDTCPINAGSR